MSGKLYIAAAGSGKTTKIIEDSLNTNKKTLILTYTITNEQQIIKRIKKKIGIIPSNITVSTWFSFLLKDGIRPYQGSRFKERIEG
ncbi:TPA: ATP-dependent DNA helicase, partial [Streptococcus agalactiae]|nr:ATP-dependent DNA helicase [Streptococcus agalactiae]